MKPATSKYVILIVFAFFVLAYLMLISAPNQKYTALEKEFLEFYFTSNPVTATWIGYHVFDDRLPDYSSQYITQRIKKLNSFEKRLDQIDPYRLKDYRKVDFHILKHAIQEERFTLKILQSYKWNPLVYVNALGFGYESLIAYEFAPQSERQVSLLGRLENTSTFVDQAIANLDTMPVPHLETAIRQVDGIISMIVTDISTWYEEQDGENHDRLEKAIMQSTMALEKFKSHLSNRFENGPHRSFRIGKKLYRQKLYLNLNEGLDDQAVLERAEAELKYIQGDMVTIAEPLYRQWFNENPDMANHTAQMKMVRSVLDKIAENHVTRDQVVSNVQSTIDELHQFIHENELLSLDATKPLEIRETPAYQRGVSIASLQAPGPLEKNLPTFYNVSPIPVDWDAEQAESFLREYNDISVKILSIHEALPGHYVQLYYANRHPSLVRSVFGSGVMVEGWAHYSEDMMIKQGFGKGDPRYTLIERKWKLRGVANAIIDQKIHAGTMTEEEAVDFMVNETFQEEAEASGKWRRAQLTSGQLSTYFVGYSLMWDLRRDVEEKLGENFSLKDFHEQLLSQGSIPVRYLREILLAQR